MRRIIKETAPDRSIRYVVEKRNIFGKWKLDEYEHVSMFGYGGVIKSKAIFLSIEDALRWFDDIKFNSIKREIL